MYKDDRQKEENAINAETSVISEHTNRKTEQTLVDKEAGGRGGASKN